MAIYELLIQNHDNTAPDLAIDKACYKQGDVICIMPIGYTWTNAERINVVKCNLTDKEKANLLGDVSSPIGDGRSIVSKRRKYGINVSVDQSKIKTVSSSNFIVKT